MIHYHQDRVQKKYFDGTNPFRPWSKCHPSQPDTSCSTNFNTYGNFQNPTGLARYLPRPRRFGPDTGDHQAGGHHGAPLRGQLPVPGQGKQERPGCWDKKDKRLLEATASQPQTWVREQENPACCSPATLRASYTHPSMLRGAGGQADGI